MTQEDAKLYLINAIRNKEPYKVYDKADGSLGILYQDTDGSYKIATRGSFESDQAKIATEMWNQPRVCFSNDIKQSSEQQYRDLLEADEVYATRFKLRDYTLCFEIIYPENRFNDGARLVCDYGNTKTLILLAAINKTTNKSLDYELLSNLASELDLPIVKQFNYTIEQLVKMKKTLPVNQEGWVIQFQSGFRVKIKGDEYCKLQKILNSISPISIWEKMQDDEEFKLTDQYKSLIPEEILPEVNELESKLKDKYFIVEETVNNTLLYFNYNYPGATIKDLALSIQAGELGTLPSGMFFSKWNNNQKDLRKQIIKIIRPKANEL